MSQSEVQKVQKGKEEVNEGSKENVKKTAKIEKYVVKCNGKEGKFSLSSFHSGQVGKSILFDNTWMTPNQFEKVAGKSKNYKRSLKIDGESLGKFLERKNIKNPTRKRICEMGKCDHF